MVPSGVVDPEIGDGRAPTVGQQAVPQQTTSTQAHTVASDPPPPHYDVTPPDPSDAVSMDHVPSGSPTPTQHEPTVDNPDDHAAAAGGDTQQGGSAEDGIVHKGPASVIEQPVAAVSDGKEQAPKGNLLSRIFMIPVFVISMIIAVSYTHLTLPTKRIV